MILAHKIQLDPTAAQAAYFARAAGTADRFFPSSKTCSHCGNKVEKLPLSIREWTCSNCGMVHDRDINATRNLKPNTDGLSGIHACGDRFCKDGH
jgi:putative transposase